MFGKKKKTNKIDLIHYEGLDNFHQDCPCVFEEKDEHFEIKRKVGEGTVILNKKQVKMIDFLSENEFMKKYHSTIAEKSKTPRCFLIIHYISKDNEEKYIALWGTTFESKKMIDLKYKFAENYDSSYSL